MLDLNPNPNCQAANLTFLTTEAHDKVSDTKQAGLGHLSKGGAQIFPVAYSGCSVGAGNPPNIQAVVLPVLHVEVPLISCSDKAVVEYGARLFIVPQETSISICLIKTQSGALGV